MSFPIVSGMIMNQGKQMRSSVLSMWFSTVAAGRQHHVLRKNTFFQPSTFVTSHQRPIRFSSSTTSSSSLPYGEGMDQQTMMESDYLIPVDKNDNPLITESISKRKAHEFNPDQPRGIAHRAFSVFLFNKENKLLLTQRASTKITFPNVWTNTCCSHPLKDMIPEEVDTNDDYPHFPGIKHAAVRKLRHELGIESKDVPLEDFVFLSRFHYWAADTITYGKNPIWGEHEIDYILFIQCEEPPTLNINDEEVSDFEYVTLDELKEYMYDESKTIRNNTDQKMLFSPWFRGIMENGGFDWMEDLNGSLQGKYLTPKIHYFDPPSEHYAEYNLESHDRDVGVLKSK